MSYKAVDVPIQRIFTINPQGNIRAEVAESFKTTYPALNDIVNQMFPPINENSSEVKETFSDFNYWRQPLPSIIDIEELENGNGAESPKSARSDSSFSSARESIESTASKKATSAQEDEDRQTGGYPFYD